MTCIYLSCVHDLLMLLIASLIRVCVANATTLKPCALVNGRMHVNILKSLPQVTTDQMYSVSLDLLMLYNDA